MKIIDIEIVGQRKEACLDRSPDYAQIAEIFRRKSCSKSYRDSPWPRAIVELWA